MDEDILSRLGRLPPELGELYSESYSALQKSLPERYFRITTNLCKWLLSAKAELPAATILLVLERATCTDFHQLTKEQVLGFCGHLVTYDQSFDTFRFVHLSVREFFETQPEYSDGRQHKIAAEFCLLQMILASATPLSKQFLQQHFHYDCGYLVWQHPNFATNVEIDERLLGLNYAYTFWAEHCRLARQERANEPLRKLFRHYLVDDTEAMLPYFEIVYDRGILVLHGTNHDWMRPMRQLAHFQEYPSIWRRVQEGQSTTDSHKRFLLSCAFGFVEALDDLLAAPLELHDIRSTRGESAMSIAIKHRELEVMRYLSNHSTKVVIDIEMQAILEAGYGSDDILLQFLVYTQSVTFDNHLLVIAPHLSGEKELLWLARPFTQQLRLQSCHGIVDFLISQRNIKVVSIADLEGLIEPRDASAAGSGCSLHDRVESAMSTANFHRIFIPSMNRNQKGAANSASHIIPIRCMPLTFSSDGNGPFYAFLCNAVTSGPRGITVVNELMKQLPDLPIGRQTIFFLLDAYSCQDSLVHGFYVNNLPEVCRAYRDVFLLTLRVLMKVAVCPEAADPGRPCGPIWSTQCISDLVLAANHAQNCDSNSPSANQSSAISAVALLWAIKGHRTVFIPGDPDSLCKPARPLHVEIMRKTAASALAISFLLESHDLIVTQELVEASLHDLELFRIVMKMHSWKFWPESVMRAILLHSSSDKSSKVGILLQHCKSLLITPEVLALGARCGRESATLLEQFLGHDPSVPIPHSLLINTFLLSPRLEVLSVLRSSKKAIPMTPAFANILQLQQRCPQAPDGKLRLRLGGGSSSCGQDWVEWEVDDIEFGSADERLKYLQAAVRAAS